MSGLKYDSRTVAAMAGDLNGMTQKSGTAIKRDCAAIRAACTEAANKSNQELSLLLLSYDYQIDLVVQALKTGDAEKATGGWESTTKKGKSKGKSESESANQHGDSGSVTSVKASTSTPAFNSDASTTKAKHKSDRKGRPQSSMEPEKSSLKTQSNGHDKKDHVAKIEPAHSKSSHAAAKVNISPVNVPKDVPIPDFHAHKGTFQHLIAQLDQTYTADLKNLDQAAEKLSRTLEHRREALRRELQTSYQTAVQTLQLRYNQAEELSSQLSQIATVSPAQFSQWQQDTAAFTADYKWDLHLASSPKFVPNLDHIQKDLGLFAHVASIHPSYSYHAASHQPQSAIGNAHLPDRLPRLQAASGDQPAHSKFHQQSHPTSAPRNNHPGQPDGRRHQQQPPVTKPDYSSYERVTIVPKDIVPGAAPVGSLVISGGNLTAEEMANLTRSLENSLRYPNPPAANPIKPVGGDIFSLSEGAIWTNSNSSAFTSDQWNTSTPDEIHIGKSIPPIGEPSLSYGNGGFRGSNAPRRSTSGYRGRGGATRGGPRGGSYRGSGSYRGTN